MAKKYKVIALSVGGLRNKIYHSGQIISDNAFIEGRADELVQKGFLERYGVSKDVDIESLKEPIMPVIGPVDVELEIDTDIAPTDKVSIDKITLKEMWDDLMEKDIDFDPNSSKEELYELWMKS